MLSKGRAETSHPGFLLSVELKLWQMGGWESAPPCESGIPEAQGLLSPPVAFVWKACNLQPPAFPPPGHLQLIL